MYLLKIGDSYFTGDSMSDRQHDAKRFDDAVKLQAEAVVPVLFGDDARFVHLKQSAQPTDAAPASV